MAFRLERTTDANGVSERIVDDHGVIALVKARGKAIGAGPTLTAAPQMLAALNVVRMSNGWHYLSLETRHLLDLALSAAESR